MVSEYAGLWYTVQILSDSDTEYIGKRQQILSEFETINASCGLPEKDYEYYSDWLDTIRTFHTFRAVFRLSVDVYVLKTDHRR